MFCPQCRTEYRHGFTNCSDCNSELVEQLPPDPPQDAMMPDTELTVVEVFSNRIDADMATTALEAAGIESMIRSDDGHGVQPALTLTRGIEVLVRSEDFDKAKEILTTEPIPEDAEVPDESEGTAAE